MGTHPDRTIARRTRPPEWRGAAGAPRRSAVALAAVALTVVAAAVAVAAVAAPRGAARPAAAESTGARPPAWRPVVRLPLEGLPARAEVTIRRDVRRAEAVVRVVGRLSPGFDAALRQALAAVDRSIVVAAERDRGAAEPTIHVLLASPATDVRIERDPATGAALLVANPLGAAPLDWPELQLPLLRYAVPGALPLWADRQTRGLDAARARLAAVEDALLAGELAEAQRRIDEFGATPRKVAPWLALLQAEVRWRAGSAAAAHEALFAAAGGTDDIAASLLARMRLAERTRAIGADLAPGELIDYAREARRLPPLVLAELLARRVRGLFLEGRHAEALAAWRELGRLEAGAPLHAALVEVARTARGRAILAHGAGGDHLGVLIAATSLPSDPTDRVTERLTAEPLARAWRALGLYGRESDVHVARLLQPLDPPELERALVGLVASFLEGEGLAQAHAALRHIERHHGQAAGEAVLATVRGELALREGHFVTALDGLRRGLAAAPVDDAAAARRLQVARLAAEIEGPAEAARLLEPLAAADRPLPGLPRGTARALSDGLLSVSGGCPALLAQAAALPAPALALQPERALVVARCARASRGAAAALILFDLVAAQAPPLLSRTARAEAADLRWELRSAGRVARFVTPPPALFAAVEKPGAPATVAATEPEPRRRARKPRRHGR
jgi:hypothetical protein